MCGLIGWISRNKDTSVQLVNDYVAEQYEEQKGRGHQGFGITEIDDLGQIHVMRAKDEVKMMVDLRTSGAKHLMLHHRFPTSTDNKVDQTHPMYVEHAELNFEWYVNHNGVIYNPQELRTEHLALGYTYKTEYETYNKLLKFNDSEAFAIELARFLEGKSDTIKTRGAAAFFAVATKDGKVVKIFVGTNGGNAVGLVEFKEGFFFASTNNYEDAKDIEDMTAVEFFPYFEKGELLGFKKKKEFRKLVFAAPTAQTYTPRTPIPAPYADDEPKTIGFRQPEPPAPAPKMLPGAQSDHFMSFTHILTYLKATNLGDVLKDDFANEAIVNYEIQEFEDLFKAGKIEEAEAHWENFIESVNDIITDASLLSNALEKDVTWPVTMDVQGTIEAAAKTTGVRMAEVAKELVPLFKLHAFIEAAVRLGYDFEVTGPKKPSPLAPSAIGPSAAEIEIHRGIYGVVHLVKECKQKRFHSDLVTETMLRNMHDKNWGLHTVADCKEPQYHTARPTTDEKLAHFRALGKDHTKGQCGQPVFHEASQEAPKAPPAEDTVVEPEWQEVTGPEKAQHEADAAVDAFISASESMNPEDILFEAENVASLLHTAASVGIEEQLRQMATLAGEDGFHLRIPFHSTQVKSILTTAENKLVAVAKIVDAARKEQEYQDGMGEARDEEIDDF